MIQQCMLLSFLFLLSFIYCMGMVPSISRSYVDHANCMTNRNASIFNLQTLLDDISDIS